jgi:hypothetical protein
MATTKSQREPPPLHLLRILHLQLILQTFLIYCIEQMCHVGKT